LAVGLILPCPFAAAVVQAEPTSDKVASTSELIAQLDSDSYDARKRATQQLIAAGADAAVPLVAAVQQGSREVMMRAIHVLDQQARSDDPIVEQAARTALQRTIQVGSSSAINRAQNALASIDRWRQDNALEKLRELGAKTSDMYLLGRTFFQAGRPTTPLVIGDDWRGQPDDLRHLRWVTDLEQIHLTGKRITDEEMKYVAQAPNLESIVLHRTSVTDAGLAFLAQMPHLSSVDIQYLTLSDEGVQHLTKIENLYRLSLKGTKVSDEGARQLAARVGEGIFDFHRGAMLGVQADPTILAGNGCPVQHVTVNSAAEACGLRGGDVIIAIDDDKVDSFETLRALMAKRGGGEKIAIQYRRGGETHSTTALLGEWPLEPIIETGLERGGLPQAQPQFRQLPPNK
jgi:hypothetical protein